MPIVALAVALVADPTLIIRDFVTRSEVVVRQPIYGIYSIVVYYYILWAFLGLYTSYRRADDEQARQHIWIVAIGTTIGYLAVLVPNIVFPWSGDYSYIWIGPLASIIMTFSVGYAIARHQLFNVKVIATQLLTFLLWVLLLVRLVFSTNFQEVLVNVTTFVFAIIPGAFLIRSVIREVKTRERIEFLAKDLETANARLTDLDRQKSEFVSIASHQLRSPLTAPSRGTSPCSSRTPRPMGRSMRGRSRPLG
ncbi:MAG: hypothetical protein COV10_02620 [Candidatus Vogelbacteria bacterium CG10_big_fil_rev_8_21_14_0_10_51_16]|uniref:Signal transduction histidine kinase dimerisation/phosphoacceptor domain-containing protein n=1 Tax=Candidatus Vogelbacteria bacterium CG10_big_fil_rev_8_21_14_0_10_51_16 TaxID=1975045 RepID=A0A2H0RFF2_9BACT|nr:MAG: hypothetical protein COV10_02620 [Candidatus Vogelbacteria bacterium CG10_big_fil_rev_8_21_14_0_10_51_16]